MTILVTGGTGTLGGPTVDLLRTAGNQPRILSRTAGTGRVVGNLTTGVGLPEALAGIDTVLHRAVFLLPRSYYRAKLASEKVIEESGIPYTILRATQFHSFVAMIPRAQRRMPVILSLDVPNQPIAVEEVAHRLVELVDAGPSGHVADIGGPEQLTVRSAIDTWQRVGGTHKPVWTVHLGGKMIRSLKAGEHMPGLPGYGIGTFAEYAARAAVTWP